MHKSLTSVWSKNREKSDQSHLLLHYAEQIQYKNYNKQSGDQESFKLSHEKQLFTN